MTRIFHRFLCERWIPFQASTSVLCLHYRPETVRSTKDVYTSEITFLALFNLYEWPFKRIWIDGWALFVYSQIYSNLENEPESPNVFSDEDPRLVIIFRCVYRGLAIRTNMYNNINKINHNHNNINNMIYIKSIDTQRYCVIFSTSYIIELKSDLGIKHWSPS